MENLSEDLIRLHNAQDDLFVEMSLGLKPAQKMEYHKILNGESKMPKDLAEEIRKAMETTHQNDEPRARRYLIGKWVKQKINIE